MSGTRIDPGKREALLAQLTEAFPAAFNADRIPLKIGIHADIAQRLPDVPADDLSLAIRWWAGSLQYLSSIACRFPRVDLDGRPSGEVPDDVQADIALRLMAMRVKLDPSLIDVRRYHEWSWRAHHMANSVGRSGVAVTLSGPDLEWARRLLARHQRFSGLSTESLAAVEVRPKRGRGRFFAVLSSGEEVFVDPLECLAAEPPSPSPLSRMGVQPGEPVFELAIAARYAKVSAQVRREDFIGAATSMHLPEGSEATVAIRTRDGGIEVGAQLASKSILKAARSASREDGDAVVQGRLGANGRIDEASISFKPQASAEA